MPKSHWQKQISHEEKVTPFTVMESTHSQLWQRLLATKYNIHPHLCVIEQVRSYPFSSTENQKSKKHLDNNVIASSAMKGFALPNKDMVICFLALFYNVFHLWKNTFKLLPTGKTFLETVLQTFFSEILRSFWFILSV